MDDVVWATAAAVLVTASFPFYLYGAWLVIDAEVVTWELLVRHLRFVVTGLVLNSVPVVVWMIPRVVHQLSGVAALHAFFGLQAYAMLTFALTGIVRIFQVKRRHDLYNEPDPELPLNELHEHMPYWRRRLRIGVAGYVLFWLFAWVIGVVRYVGLYRVYLGF